MQAAWGLHLNVNVSMYFNDSALCPSTCNLFAMRLFEFHVAIVCRFNIRAACPIFLFYLEFEGCATERTHTHTCIWLFVLAHLILIQIGPIPGTTNSISMENFLQQITSNAKHTNKNYLGIGTSKIANSTKYNQLNALNMFWAVERYCKNIINS